MDLFWMLATIIALHISSCMGMSYNEYFLVVFGYVKLEGNNTDRTEVLNPELVTESVKKFQIYNGLNETGVIDKETSKLITTPRCGNKDYYRGLASSFTAVSPWSKKLLSWKVKNYSKTSKLTTIVQLQILKKAFEHWSKVSDLSFNYKPENKAVDITMSFEKREHGDNNPFDERGNVLGHAFYPNSGSFKGMVHFDDDEDWTANTSNGTNLEFVAVHELGHALGLAHSTNIKSVMAPFYRGYVQNFALEKDDVRGIQSLYGAAPMSTTTISSTIISSTIISINKTNGAESTHDIFLLVPALSLMSYGHLLH